MLETANWRPLSASSSVKSFTTGCRRLERFVRSFGDVLAQANSRIRKERASLQVHVTSNRQRGTIFVLMLMMSLNHTILP
jgi:hypothetical protein